MGSEPRIRWLRSSLCEWLEVDKNGLESTEIGMGVQVLHR